MGMSDVGKSYIQSLNENKLTDDDDEIQSKPLTTKIDLDHFDAAGECAEGEEDGKPKFPSLSHKVAHKTIINLRNRGDENDHNEGVYDYDGYYDAGTGGDRRDNSKPVYDRWGNVVGNARSGRSAEEAERYNKMIGESEKERGELPMS